MLFVNIERPRALSWIFRLHPRAISMLSPETVNRPTSTKENAMGIIASLIEGVFQLIGQLIDRVLTNWISSGRKR